MRRWRNSEVVVMSNLLVIGAGGHGRVIADAAEAMGQWQHIAFADDNKTTGMMVGRWEVVGTTENLNQLLDKYDFAVVGVGAGQARLNIQDKLAGAGFRIATIIHPGAIMAKGVQVGEGSVIFAGAVVNIGTIIERACIINTNATVDHDCHLSDAVHVCPGVQLAGEVKVGKFSWVGIGSSVIQQIVIGENVVIGAGAAVINAVESNVTVVGIPARIAKEN